MANVLTKGTMLPEHLVSELFSLVNGHSSLAKLSGQSPMPFNGIKEFTFALDKEADIVAENGAKSNGGMTISPVTITPIKFEYGARVSDEFKYGSEEYQMNVLAAFTDGAAKKFARALDLAAFHGVNPRTGAASAVVGTNNFDSKVTANVVTYAAAGPDQNIEDALTTIETNGAMATGIVMAPAMRTALAQMRANGVRVYPDFAFGANPGLIGGMTVDVNNTVSAVGSNDVAILGDFRNAFKWGYAKEIPIEIIEYGNPDNDAEAGDLKGHNQIYLRAEAYIGWGILVPEYFARVTTE